MYKVGQSVLAFLDRNYGTEAVRGLFDNWWRTDDFEQLLDFLEEAQLDRVGCFQYSPVKGAAANELPDPVPDKLKQQRWERFMSLQQEISAARLQAKIGKTIEILIDSVDEQGAIGRSSAKPCNSASISSIGRLHNLCRVVMEPF